MVSDHRFADKIDDCFQLLTTAFHFKKTNSSNSKKEQKIKKFKIGKL